ncbi:hypothetical protein SLEP1_g55299 [Rubroshorea leprosula]|uniref:Uncharacterized protein n=1 Tax=Rubroshorea leprosula TaxID=152421 RepID=A0AAV5MHH2_9ROSI|nr:hypothetical protein SLEP1_g55299 [Rubroshorea leprosula]
MNLQPEHFPRLPFLRKLARQPSHYQVHTAIHFQVRHWYLRARRAVNFVLLVDPLREQIWPFEKLRNSLETNGNCFSMLFPFTHSSSKFTIPIFIPLPISS